jgi:hypothetical protein
LHRGQKQRDEHANDGDDDQKLNQGEGPAKGGAAKKYARVHKKSP